ncbi:MAG: hypothetical protein Q8L23_10165 [Caulobacter sp.]|nr:hypothetical protein [Caulobacter sp.]
MTETFSPRPPRNLEEPYGYAGGLVMAYGLGLLGVFGGPALAQLIMPLYPDNTLAYAPTLVIVALSPIPVVAATTLLVRIYGVWRGLWAAPAAIAVIAITGIFQLLILAGASGMSL